MINKSTFDFLENLSRNNNREWFNDNKKLYQDAKLNFEEFIAELIKEINKFDPFVGDLEPKNCVFRIFKDVRFSKNKDPYKTNFGAAISRGGRKSSYPGYYLHIKPNDSFFAGGVYMPESNILASIRQEIDYNFKDFKEIVENKSFVKEFGNIEGDKLKRPPKGYSEDNPAIEYLKFKSFLMVKKIDNSEVLKDDYLKAAVDSFKKMKPLNDFLKGPVTDIIEKED